MSVRHALLALLSEGPKYGLQLRQEFEARTGEVWPLNVGQVYTTLQRLERDGLVESETAPTTGRRRSSGSPRPATAELATWLRTPPDLSSPPRDELVMKVLVAIRLPGVDVHEVIQAHRRYLVELMQQWTRIKEDASRGRPRASRSSSTPSCSGSTRSSAGSTRPTPGSGGARADAAGRAGERPDCPKLRRRRRSTPMSMLELRQRLQGLRRGRGRGARPATTSTCRSRRASWSR